MKSTTLRAAVLLVAVLLANVATAQQAAPQRVTSVEGITEYRLANGLRVLLFPDQSKPTVTVNITYLVGSAQEGYGETGMAHLLEHMQFKGSTNHTNIYQELTSRGARTNASTWFERTNYYETLPASDDNVRWALGLEADRMVNSFIAQKDLDSEMTVVRNELEEGENDPESGPRTDREHASLLCARSGARSGPAGAPAVSRVDVAGAPGLPARYLQRVRRRGRQRRWAR